MPLPPCPVPARHIPLLLLLAMPTMPAGAADVHRQVPDGTLTYHVVLTGHASRAMPGGSDSTTLERHFDVTVRLHGDATNAEGEVTQQGPALASLARAAEACGNDQACLMRAAMSAKGQALHRESGQIVDAIGADTLWMYQPGMACRGTAKVSAHETLDETVSGEGEAQRVVSHGQVAGQADVGCRDDAGYRLVIHRRGGYDLAVPAVEVRATLTKDHEASSRPVTVRIPQMNIHGRESAAPDRPQRGHKTFPVLFTEPVTPIYSTPLSIPVRAEVDWTFMPDHG